MIVIIIFNKKENQFVFYLKSSINLERYLHFSSLLGKENSASTPLEVDVSVLPYLLGVITWQEILLN